MTCLQMAAMDAEVALGPNRKGLLKAVVHVVNKSRNGKVVGSDKMLRPGHPLLQRAVLRHTLSRPQWPLIARVRLC